MNNLEKAIESILKARQLTRDDQTMLMRMLFKKQLSPTDAVLINRVHEALNQGRLRVVD